MFKKGDLVEIGLFDENSIQDMSTYDGFIGEILSFGTDLESDFAVLYCPEKIDLYGKNPYERVPIQQLKVPEKNKLSKFKSHFAKV